MWLSTVFFFDRQTYMIFTPGQLKVRLEIGGGETAYDTQGMTVAEAAQRPVPPLDPWVSAPAT